MIKGGATGGRGHPPPMIFSSYPHKKKDKKKKKQRGSSSKKSMGIESDWIIQLHNNLYLFIYNINKLTYMYGSPYPLYQNTLALPLYLIDMV